MSSILSKVILKKFRKLFTNGFNFNKITKKNKCEAKTRKTCNSLMDINKTSTVS